MFLWSFAKAGQMIGRRFTDDVAIVFAATKSGAIRKFQSLYLRIEEKEVQPISLKKILKRPEILTDY